MEPSRSTGRLDIGPVLSSGLGPLGANVPSGRAALGGNHSSKSQIDINFHNMPRGTRVDTKKAAPGLNLGMGYSNVFP
jgi:hypothetical protein